MASATKAIVVDASVATKWHLSDEDYTDQALRLLHCFAYGEIELVAPEQIRYEVPSAITVATVGENPRLTLSQGREAVEEFLSLGLTTVGDSELILAAYPLVHQHDRAFYDALYLALAERMGLPFVMADHKLYQKIRHLPYVVWIGDYPSAAT